MSLGTGAVKERWARSASRGMTVEITMATLRVPTTRHHHTERISGLLTYPYLAEIVTGREGAGVKDLQRFLE